MDVDVVVGCAGSGKSTYLAKIAQTLPPDDTLILSYSRSAAATIAAKAGPKYKSSTLHALCFHDLEVIPDQMLQGKRINDFCKSINVEPPDGGYEIYNPDTHFMEVYNYARTTGGDVYDIYFKYSDLNFTFAEYVKYVSALTDYKDTYGLYEFHDLLDLYCPTSAPANVFIDESQDMSYTLIRALEKLVMCGTKRLILLGDPIQSIYTYSGADPKYMHHFNGKERFLDQSWRCPKEVVKKAKTLFPDAKFKPTQSDGVVDVADQVPEDADLVLVRTNYIRHKVIKATEMNPKKVMTIHKSKGMQGNSVVLINATTKRIQKSTEHDPLAEKRVLYTAITRAKERLTIVEGKNPNEWI